MAEPIDIADGTYSFVVHPIGGALRYEGAYKGGVRDGLWRVTKAETGVPCWEVTWVRGEWHGPSRSWNRAGQVTEDGEYAHGRLTGLWTFRFETGQLAARGRYESDRKTGSWEYWDKDGHSIDSASWEREYSDYDFAFDDYSGMPRGENWPHPPGASDS